MKIPMSLSSRPNMFPAAMALVLVAACIGGFPLQAQNANQPVPAAGQPVPQKLNPQELSQLLAPIALYPDALIALILPASTVPSDVVLGARYVQANGDPNLAKNQPWDESVKSLTRYPDVLAWMDQNLDWTASVGEAFVDQPADVMNAVQALREQAKAAGNLRDTPQQRVVQEEKIIRIVPADPEMIFVPQYDPEIVYVQSYSPDPLLTFGLGFAVGSWLNYDFDWNRQRIYRGQWRGWNHDWNDYGGYGGNQADLVNIDFNNANQWQPSASGQRQTIQRQRNNNGNVRYATARSSAFGAGQQVQGVASGTVQPALQTALPRPSRLAASPGRNGPNRGQPTDRSGNPAVSMPATSAVINTLPGTTKTGKTPNRSGNLVTQTPEVGSPPLAPQVDQGKRISNPPGSSRKSPNSPTTTASPGSPGAVTPNITSGQQKRSRSIQTPSTPPQVPGQMNSRSQTQESRGSGPRSSIPKSTPESGNVRVPASQAPQAAPQTGERARTQTTTQGSRNKAPSDRQASQPTQAAPVIKQSQERQQVQPQRQQQQAQPQRQQQQAQPQRQQQQAQPQRQQQQTQPQRQQQQAQPQRQQQKAPSAPAAAKQETKAPAASPDKPSPDKNGKKKPDEKKQD